MTSAAEESTLSFPLLHDTLQFFENSGAEVMGNFSDDDDDDDDDDDGEDEESSSSSSKHGDDDEKDSSRAPPLAAPGKFGRRAESEDWSAEELEVKEEVLGGLSAMARSTLEGDDLLMVRLTRGYWTYEPRVDILREVCEEVAAWRRKWGSPEMLLRGPLSCDSDRLFHRKVWPSYVTGSDQYGHLVVLERFSTLKWEAMAHFEIEDLLKLRVQALDALQREVKRRSTDVDFPRVYKTIFIIDVGGATFSNLMNAKVLEFAKQYARVTEKMYADGAWTNLVVNAPAVARAAWKIVERVVDEETRDIVAFAPVGNACVAALRDLGVPDEAVPKYLGGKANLNLLVADLIEKEWPRSSSKAIAGKSKRGKRSLLSPEKTVGSVSAKWTAQAEQRKKEEEKVSSEKKKHNSLCAKLVRILATIWHFYEAFARVFIYTLFAILRLFLPRQQQQQQQGTREQQQQENHHHHHDD